MTVGLVDGLIKSCGSELDTKDCYDYNPVTGSWTTSADMLITRDLPKSSFIDGVWLVSGDHTGSDDHPGSTEMWTGSRFEEGPALPIEMKNPCQLTINSTHVFFADTYETGKAYLLDWHLQAWTELPRSTVDRSYPSCGLINNPENGLEVVIVENRITEIFSLNSLSWREGPSVDYFNRAGSAQLADTFVVVGGYNFFELDTIYKFDHINYDWILMSQTLQHRKEFPGVVAVPDEFVTCS